MPTNLDSFYSNKFRQSSTTQLETILCILEGGDELSFIKKIYEIYNSSIECTEFLHSKIKLSYGRGLIEWQGDTSSSKNQNQKKCNFQGGDYLEKAPLPILTSLNNEDLELYKAIIVMYDKDRDQNNKVEDLSNSILSKYSNKILFLSTPCFEKESITFFSNTEIENYITDNYQIIEHSKCLWFKRNYSILLRKNPIKHKQKLSTLIPALDKNHLENSTINHKMKALIYFIKTHI